MLRFMGATYGGYAALTATTKTLELFACIVGIFGVSNLITFHGHDRASGRAQPYFGFGKIAKAEANSAGWTTWISLFCTCRAAPRPPSFWPLTNLVGP